MNLDFRSMLGGRIEDAIYLTPKILTSFPLIKHLGIESMLQLYLQPTVLAIPQIGYALATSLCQSTSPCYAPLFSNRFTIVRICEILL
jgi:hypothetical protein